MMRRKLLAGSVCLIAICAVIAWPVGKHLDAARKLAESVRRWRVRADQGDPDAQYRLGSAYYYGSGVPRDYGEAVEWYRKAAAQGHAAAQYAAGYCSFLGRGIPQDYPEALRWYRKAADQGDARSQYALASMYGRGEGVARDPAEAVRWARRAAERGHIDSQLYLGWAYRYGRGVPQDLAEAARWYRKAAEQGDMAAQWYLGKAYHNGIGVPRDRVQAVRWRVKVVARAAWHCARRLGWTGGSALVLAIGVLGLPRRVWQQAIWLRPAVLSVAAGLEALHVTWRGCWLLGRGVEIGFFATLSATCGLLAVAAAVDGKKRGLHQGQLPVAPAETTAGHE